jgi:hypothetical protein
MWPGTLPPEGTVLPSPTTIWNPGQNRNSLARHITGPLARAPISCLYP